ncbi:hypothetical protein ACPENL_003236 [Yersinia enterocolitica]|nr:hypothetical protein [Yersinia enterocolitica]HDL8219181.1 hypothetical protein [Yersinia enterocolitica]HDL8223836.1 hypothetical protein [Yersinia enterocolitica]HEN3490844.1 hypothetical protein [Yersinia enterocolitica]
MPNKLRAYSVQGDDFGCIVFAKSGIVARRNGASELDLEFSEIVSCRLIPALDKYVNVKGGVPWKILVEEHDWSQECGYCNYRVSRDDIDRVWNEDDQIYCSIQCQARREDVDRKRKKEAEEADRQKLSAIAAAKAKFTGAYDFSSNLLVTKNINVTFRFPDCKWCAHWFPHDDSVTVSPDDLKAWEEYAASLKAKQHD